MRGNLPGPEGWQERGSAALHGLSIVSTMDCAARLASVLSLHGLTEIFRQAPTPARTFNPIYEQAYLHAQFVIVRGS